MSSRQHISIYNRTLHGGCEESLQDVLALILAGLVSIPTCYNIEFSKSTWRCEEAADIAKTMSDRAQMLIKQIKIQINHLAVWRRCDRPLSDCACSGCTFTEFSLSGIEYYITPVL